MPNADMDSRSFDKHATPRPIPVYIAPTMDESDEISLVDLWRVLVRRKAIILISFLASLLLAFAYLFFAEPMYKANAYLLPPQQREIQGLLINYRGIEEVIEVGQYTSDSVYSVFLDNLNSQRVRREFFDSHELLKYYAAGESTENTDADRIFVELFNNRLKVQLDKQSTSFVTVNFTDSDPKLAAQWLNQIIDFANKRTVYQLFSDVKSAIQSEIDQVRFQLDSKLKLAEKRRADRIAALNEALHTAATLGIKDLVPSANNTKNTQAELVVNTAQIPLIYARNKGAGVGNISA